MVGVLTIVTSTAVQPAGLTVTLSRSGQTSISVSSPPVDSSCTVITAFINKPVSAGTWDVTVTNSDGSYGVLTGGFTVS